MWVDNGIKTTNIKSTNQTKVEENLYVNHYIEQLEKSGN